MQRRVTPLKDATYAVEKFIFLFQCSKKYLLYKNQWNTRWAFARKHEIFTRENNTLFSHVKISPLLWLHNKSRLSLFHWCRCAQSWNISQHSKGNFVSPSGHVISSMFLFFSVARLKSTKLGIKLVGGTGQNFIHGDPGIFVSRVRPGSLADGRLYPGDRMVAVCIIALSSYHANLLIQSTLALRTPR